MGISALSGVCYIVKAGYSDIKLLLRMMGLFTKPNRLGTKLLVQRRQSQARLSSCLKWRTTIEAPSRHSEVLTQSPVA